MIFGLRKNGDPRFPISERLYPIDTIKIFFKEDPLISQKVIESYQNGQSIADIAKLIGRSKSFVRLRLERAGIEPREKLSQATHVRQIKRGKQGARPYYGFCYLEGEIVKDPREFPTLVLIHERWASKKTTHEIVKELNRKAIPSRKGKSWSWAALQNIVTRFEEGHLKISKGGKYEFR
ncbi:recombinase family protein [Bdellovibrio bacteriovorus]|uniref:recombinase family protein n=1 Tax=Bdellovibrio bacteriovorus TaxID=959 RepID=UPI0005A03464|nr:recombinase family protein [Bdellovibrio bacteriovorus]